MIKELMYIELKTGYSDDGPAWIGYVQTSNTRKTFISMIMLFRRILVTMQTIWTLRMVKNIGFPELKKEESNRHWAGHGKIMIDRRAVDDYLTLIGEKELPSNLFEIVGMEDRFPVERVNKRLNAKH